MDTDMLDANFSLSYININDNFRKRKIRPGYQSRSYVMKGEGWWSVVGGRWVLKHQAIGCRLEAMGYETLVH